MARRALRMVRQGMRRLSTLAFEEMEPELKQHKTAMVLHGLLGSARNWRGFAKLLRSSIDPEWRIVMVDLRNHGQSAQLHFPPPHGIPSAAEDVANLIKAQPHLTPDVLIGHSMGGKVVLEFTKGVMNRAYGNVNPPKQVWVLDSVAGEVPIKNEEGEVEKVLATIKTLPNPIPSRRWLVDHMVGLGFTKPLANWLGSNLKTVSPDSEESTWVFDITGAYEMFKSYRETDYWSLLENPPPGTDIGFVRAAKSDRWSPEIISRLESLSKSRPGSDSGTVTYRILENAGHWVHVDNPQGLLQILLPSFRD